MTRKPVDRYSKQLSSEHGSCQPRLPRCRYIRDKLADGDDRKLWDEARSAFSMEMHLSDDLRPDFNSFMSSMTTSADARSQCKELHDNTDKQYSSKPLTIKGRTVIPKDFLKSVLVNMDAFIKLGDVATKGGAESVLVAWSCLKFVLLAVQADSANCAHWAQAADSISRILLNCKTFARLYSMPDSKCEPSSIADDLLSLLPATYKAILRFSDSPGPRICKSGITRLGACSIR